MKRIVIGLSLLLAMCLCGLPALAEDARTYGSFTLEIDSHWMAIPGNEGFDQFFSTDNVALASLRYEDLSDAGQDSGAFDPAIMRGFIEYTLKETTHASELQWIERDDGALCCMSPFSFNDTPAMLAMLANGPDLVTVLFSLPAGNDVDLDATARQFLALLHTGADAAPETEPAAAQEPAAPAETAETGDAPEADGAPDETAGGFRIAKVPMVVRLSEDDYNVFTQDNDPDSPSMQRCGYPVDKVNLYTQGVGIDLLVGYKDEDFTAFNIQIRVKDEKYPGHADWDTLDDAGIGAEMSALFMQDGSASSYDIHRTPGFAWTRFAMKIDGSNGLRFVTIKNHDIIYVHAHRYDSPLTDDDLALLETVVNAIELG